MRKVYLDYLSEEDYNRHNELLALAEEAKKNAPKAPRAPRGPMTAEQKIKLAEGRMAKAQALIAKLMAEQNG